ncbi:MAG: DUF2075 domain-containing protein, partial [Lachnospiraceae bacterium]|nr:DUF2075 domain-containing protein [Lachnospiraceae bacterium]
QQQMKENILTGIRTSKALLWGITEEAGTGKTVLLYDVAKALSDGYAVGVIHCGKLSEGHQKLRGMLEGVDVFEANNMDPQEEQRAGLTQEQYLQREMEEAKNRQDRLVKYDVICVDETQRLRGEELREILQAYHMGKIKACIFIYDLKQVLSKSEQEQNNPAKLKNLAGFTELALTKTIRTSKEIYAFIGSMLDLKKRSNSSFAGIDLLWAGKASETERILEHYRKLGYRYIAMPSSGVRTLDQSCQNNTEYEDSHDVIGLEFDAVTVVLDGRFHYDEAGKLIGAQDPFEDYLYVQMLYQNVSRAKEKLCVIVQENEAVFRELVRILDRS